ncbi:hypothetical protein T440DRAFT_495630 [Plenodomus tracheiphilus IPT5]|uniref:Peptidase S9 prolyl oligopeptidase catalytic domain-containing protein n=1 Tax=Plenodomus tracheiphilus IPT5 TaxID=1408161 RepID=A0A6A7BHH4_9PLEO|nr:hypothetical protein T440DRAFT_495630 [Plenodomus tracheiphilus IPT5]
MYTRAWLNWAFSPLLLQQCHASYYDPLMAPLAGRQPRPSLFSFNSTWQVLGPFQIGTREATWGADPLEYVGGFRNLSYDPDATFRSSLPTNGTAKWNVTKAVKTVNEVESANATLSVTYSNVDWDFVKIVYGWAAVQYQAWARGEFFVNGNETQHVIVHTDAILEFWIDDTHYFGGDFYTFRKSPPVLHLEHGPHKIDLRLVRDVRAFGGILAPTIDVVVDIQSVSGSLELSKPGILVSDVVDGTLASSIVSVYLRNSGSSDIEILDIQATDANDTSSSAYVSSGLVISAGQTRPVAFNVSLPGHNSSYVNYTIAYKTVNSTNHSTLHVSQHLQHTSIYKPHKITFLHPSGIVSYAMLRPPAENANCQPHRAVVPILLVLHGAGLEADNPMVTGSLDPVSELCAWVLFPTGVTPWSGDDWHNWGFADVEAAIDAIPAWITNVNWDGPGVDIDRWIVTGHSNGGQGTWYALSHRPDKVLAAAPISGYASIQKYVSYELWQPTDPRRTTVLSASLNSYRHEMLVANLKGIPIQQQHGEIDDNVPAYNSRFLAQQLYLSGVEPSYNEVKGKNHWWDTVMTTPELVDFYIKQVDSQEVLPRKVARFSITVGDPGDMGSKNGIKVLHLVDPGQYGRVEVKGRAIHTSNIQNLEFDPTLWSGPIIIDGQDVELIIEDTAVSIRKQVRISRVNRIWSVISSVGVARKQRSGRQLGSMTAILRSNGPFIILHSGSTSTAHVALQVSRNLHQYFQADAAIIPRRSAAVLENTTGNVVSLVVGPDLEDQEGYAIRVDGSGVTIRDHQGYDQQYGEEARGAAFLRPLEDERLELVLWGADNEGLRHAARIVPMLTGVGQPDFVVFGESAKWKGVEGIVAMGFLNSDWEITASSVVETG